MSDAGISSPEELGALLEGRTDDEINETVAAQGTDTVLDAIFNGMQERFQADKAAGQTANVQWDVTTTEGVKSYQLQVADGKCEVKKDAGDPARVTLGLSLPDFLRMITGKLDGMQAFMSGKLKLSGDMLFAQTIQSWFAQ